MCAIAAYRMPMQTGFSEEVYATDNGSQDLSSGHPQTKTANFVYYTIEVPVDWTQVGTGQMQPGDKSLLVIALNLSGIEGTAAPEQDAAAMKTLMAELEKTAMRTLTSQGCKLIQEFSARDIDEERSLIRGVFQASNRYDGRTILRQGPNLRGAAAGHGQARRRGNDSGNGSDPFLSEMAEQTNGSAAVDPLSVLTSWTKACEIRRRPRCSERHQAGRIGTA